MAKLAGMCVLLHVAGLCLLSSHCAIDKRPVVGIILITTLNNTRGQYYMYADYRSFIEQSGGAAVPIFLNQSGDYYDNLMSRLNGVLLPGGGVDIISSMYGQQSYKIFQAATKMNDAGNYFPILGICLGMQEMTSWPFNPRKNLTVHVAGTEDVSLPLNFTSAASKSRLYGNMPANIREILTKQNVTPNFHHYALPLKTYNTRKELLSFFSVTSMNMDTKGLEFISSMEAYKYPFYGLQWHPEKINYWFKLGNKINHSHDAVLVGQYISNFFVNEARKSKQTFHSVSELSRFLLNNYPTTFHRNDFVITYDLNDSDVPEFDEIY